MNVIKVLKKVLIDSQIYVSLMGALLAAFCMLEQNTFRFPTFFLILITYFSGYLYTKYQNSRYFIPILLLNCFAGIICTLIIIHNHNYTRLAKWVIIIVLGLLYNSQFLTTYIRKIPLLKVFYVGLVWGLVNSWLSFHQWNAPLFFITFLYITALVLPFDIRDVKTDTITTFPKIIGIEKTKYLAYLMLFGASLIGIYYLQTPYSIAIVASSIVSSILIYFADDKKQDSYFSFGIETCCGLPLIFLYIIQYFTGLN